MCFQCFVYNNNQTGCVQCQKKSEATVTEDMSIPGDDFDDFDQNQLFDEWTDPPSALDDDDQM